MSREFLTLSEAVADLEAWIDADRLGDDPSICILPPDQNGVASDEEFLDENEILRKENQETFPRKVAGRLEVEGVLSEWDEEDEIPLKSLASQISSIKFHRPENVKWQKMDSIQGIFTSFPKNTEFSAKEDLEKSLACCSPVCKSQTVFKCIACSRIGNDIPLHVKCSPIFHQAM